MHGPVHWSEGMLLLPHHFQAADAHLHDVMATLFNWSVGYGYGVNEIEIHRESLANFELRVPRLRVRLKDGSVLFIPELGTLEVLDLRDTFSRETAAYVHLVLPELVPGRANASRQPRSDQRHQVVDAEWEDRNEEGAVRSLEFKRTNARLACLATPEAIKGFVSLPIARLRRSPRAEAPPEIDPAYFPPLLDCRAWPQLHVDILTTVRSRLGNYLKQYAERLRKSGGWGMAGDPDTRKRIAKLSAINQSYPVLSQLIGMRGIHPTTAYVELCRLVGQLALFREDWQSPDLPTYDHDNLGPIFRRVFDEIGRLLEEEPLPFEQFPFRGVLRGDDKWLEIALDPAWIQGGRELYVGVKSNLDPKRLQGLFHPAWLNWKLGSSKYIMEIFRRGEHGCDLELGKHPSMAGNIEDDITTYKIIQQGPYWDQVIENRMLALKINDPLVEGDYQGRETVNVRDPRQTIRTLSFYLYVVRK